MIRFFVPFVKSTSLGPNQVIRGRSGLMAPMNMGSQPEWWLETSWNGAAGHFSSPSPRTLNSVWTMRRTRTHCTR